MKTSFRLLAAAGIFALLAFAFGYFDEELGDERRWVGAGLILVGMAVAWPALRRLAEDWPRLKPQYNVDLAFAQLALSAAILVGACLLGGRFGATMMPLVKPTPQLTQPAGDLGASPQPPAGAQGAGGATRR
ncbi:MAG: hypothetical protein NTV51_19685 [Verrucomicrobia bacterium]|nr:hypothetical protein [Verrucomicrobiota bacterium]